MLGTAVVIVFELTGECSLILPLMLAVVLASAVAGAITSDAVHTAKLLRRGIDIDEPADAALRRRPVGDIAVPSAPPPPSPRSSSTSSTPAAGSPVGEALRRLEDGAPAVPVAGADGSVSAWVGEHDVLAVLSAHGDVGLDRHPRSAHGGGVTPPAGRPSAGT